MRERDREIISYGISSLKVWIYHRIKCVACDKFPDSQLSDGDLVICAGLRNLSFFFFSKTFLRKTQLSSKWRNRDWSPLSPGKTQAMHNSETIEFKTLGIRHEGKH